MENRIEARRTVVGISKSKLARDAGVSRGYLGRVIKGEYTPSVTVALNICDELGTSVEDVFKNARRFRRSSRFSNAVSELMDLGWVPAPSVARQTVHAIFPNAP